MREHKPSQCVVARPRETSAARAITWCHPRNDGGSEGSRPAPEEMRNHAGSRGSRSRWQLHLSPHHLPGQPGAESFPDGQCRRGH